MVFDAIGHRDGRAEAPERREHRAATSPCVGLQRELRTHMRRRQRAPVTVSLTVLPMSSCGRTAIPGNVGGLLAGASAATSPRAAPSSAASAGTKTNTPSCGSTPCGNFQKRSFEPRPHAGGTPARRLVGHEAARTAINGAAGAAPRATRSAQRISEKSLDATTSLVSPSLGQYEVAQAAPYRVANQQCAAEHGDGRATPEARRRDWSANGRWRCERRGVEGTISPGQLPTPKLSNSQSAVVRTDSLGSSWELEVGVGSYCFIQRSAGHLVPHRKAFGPAPRCGVDDDENRVLCGVQLHNRVGADRVTPRRDPGCRWARHTSSSSGRRISARARAARCFSAAGQLRRPGCSRRSREPDLGKQRACTRASVAALLRRARRDTKGRGEDVSSTEHCGSSEWY